MTEPTPKSTRESGTWPAGAGASSAIGRLDSDAVLRAFFENAPGLMGVVELTKDGDVLHVIDNAAACRFFGVGPGETANRPATELFSTRAAAEKWRVRYAESAASRAPVQFEYGYDTRAGERWLSVTVAPMDAPMEAGTSGSSRFCYVANDVTDQKLAEDRLRTSETTLRMAIHAGYAIAFTWDIERNEVRRVHSTSIVLPATHAAPDTYEGVRSKIHPDDRERFDAAVRAALVHPEGLYAAEFRLLLPGGELRWMRETGCVEFANTGRPLRLIGLSTDLTDRKLAEEAVRASEERYRLLADMSPQFVWLASTDGSIEYVNQDWYDYTGLTPEETFRPEGWTKAIHPEHRERIAKAWTEGLTHGRPWNQEIPFRRASDGAYRWHVSHAKPIRGEDGSILRWIGVASDVDDLKQAEAALRETSAELEARQRELQTVTDNTPDVLTRFDRNLRHVFVNAAVEKATGRRREDFLGKTNREVGMPAELCELWDNALRDVFATGKEREIAFSFESQAGKRFYSAWLVPEYGRNGSVDYVLGFAHDVTHRKRYEDALTQADRRKDEFLATLAHELRNPLAPIRLGLEVLKRCPEKGPAAVGARDMMERQVGHMVRLIDDLLDISRISRGKIQLERRRVSVRSVLDHAVEASRPSIEASRHELFVRASDEPIWLDGDPMRLAQVVSNLLNNAAKYTPRGGRIDLSASVEQGQAVIRVADNGAGIPGEMLPNVFDLFVQGAGVLERSQGGLGIGLALVRKLVDMHGGTVEGESAGVGRGSTFTVRLPVARIPVARTNEKLGGPSGDHGEENASPAPRRRVLVVDDNEDAAEMLMTILMLSGHETRIAFDGPEALAVANAFSPEVVFLDVGLPGMTGYEVARTLRSDPRTCDATLVAVTGWGSQEDKRRSQEAGFDFHLTKPVEPGVVDGILARAVYASGTRS